jgi:hypothetical protein
MLNLPQKRTKWSQGIEKMTKDERTTEKKERREFLIPIWGCRNIYIYI